MTNQLDLEKREALIKAYEAFAHVLTTNQKQVFHLHYIEDLSIGEIAQIVATTRGSVFDTLKKALKKLEPFLKNL